MTERRPLVIVNGRQTELPVGDTLPGVTASSGAGEILVASGITPPSMLTSSDDSDFVYESMA